MPKHFDNKADLLKAIRQVKQAKATAERSPFSTGAIMGNWLLAFKEKWSRPKVAEYNQRLNELYTSNPDYVAMAQKIMDKVGWTVEYEAWKPVNSSKNAYINALNNDLIQADNKLMEHYTYFMLCHFSTLIDMGYGQKRLTRHKDDINKILDDSDKNGNSQIMKYHKELMDWGVVVELPKYYKGENIHVGL